MFEPSCYALGPELKCISYAAHSLSLGNSVPIPPVPDTGTKLKYTVPLASGVNYIKNGIYPKPLKFISFEFEFGYGAGTPFKND